MTFPDSYMYIGFARRERLAGLFAFERAVGEEERQSLAVDAGGVGSFSPFAEGWFELDRANHVRIGGACGIRVGNRERRRNLNDKNPFLTLLAFELC